MYLDPRDKTLYCQKNISNRYWPRCPLLEKLFNHNNLGLDLTSEILFPPNLVKPPQSQNHYEYRINAIKGLKQILDWWVSEELDDKLLCHYAYNYGPCLLRVCVLDQTLNILKTEFDYTNPATANELKDLWDKLTKSASKWDKSCPAKSRLPWVDPQMVEPVEVKRNAATLLYKLKQIGSLVQAYNGKQQGNKLDGEGGQGDNENEREIDSETKEQAWRDEAPEYITNADAVRMAVDKISSSGLSKLLRKPGNTIRWMRNKETRRSKVHTQDFKKYILKLKVTDEFSEAAFKQRERQQEIDSQKRNTGR